MIYSEDYQIPCYMFDAFSRLRPASFMDIAQELAAKDSERLRFADNYLSQYNYVWIVSRMSVRFDKVPHRLDSVTAQTWHRGLDGIFFVRDYRLLGADGSVAVSSTSCWNIMNTVERRVVRGDRIGDIINPCPESDESALEGISPRLSMPEGAVKAGEHMVVYSDLDYNGHVNNARYVQWAFDVLPYGIVSDGAAAFDVNFNREAHFPETVDLLVSSRDGFTYVEGKVAEERIFTFRCR